jgi:TatA/E family protein of Tat protein translocase
MGHIEGMDMACASLAFIDGLGAPEMMLIFVVILVLFGGQKLPEFARGLGKSIREFKKAAAGVEEEFKRALEEDERKHATPTISTPSSPALTAAVGTQDHAGPEAPVPIYDEYGNEVPPETAGNSTDGVTSVPPLESVSSDAAAANSPDTVPGDEHEQRRIEESRKPATPAEPAPPPAERPANP